MKDEDFIVSGFGNVVVAEFPFAVDFSKAKKLDRSGSTCDAYECTIHHRRVFVKRLKAEYRDNPLYRAAFSKEYELGVTLSHKSLPRYVGFGEDYLALDFVEGDTMADLIKRDDERLKDKKFVRKLLRELVDVVEYLHNRNIVHCDIKADNVMISPYPDRPVMLIDLDKARSPWLDTTHGDTAKYGCEECADGVIDFKAIGLLAKNLGLKNLVGNQASAESLRRSLRENKRARWWIIIASAGIAAGIGSLVMFNNANPNDNAVAPIDKPEILECLQENVHEPEPETASMSPVYLKQSTLDTTWISTKIADKEAEIMDYGQTLLEILNCDTISISDKRYAILDYTYSVGLATNDIIYSSVRRFADVDEMTVQNAVRSSAGWQRIEAREKDIHSQINAWTASIKESQHSSGHPALLPDTIPGDTLPAQHR